MKLQKILIKEFTRFCSTFVIYTGNVLKRRRNSILNDEEMTQWSHHRRIIGKYEISCWWFPFVFISQKELMTTSGARHKILMRQRQTDDLFWQKMSKYFLRSYLSRTILISFESSQFWFPWILLIIVRRRNWNLIHLFTYLRY